MPEITAWQNRPLEPVYPFVFIDAIHYKVKEDHRYITKTAYVVLGITLDGKKDILGVWIGEHESSKFWLNVLNDLKSRGVLDIYLFCTDGLCGMMQAIQAVYPKSRLQHCMVHQTRSSTKYISYKDLKRVIADPKKSIPLSRGKKPRKIGVSSPKSGISNTHPASRVGKTTGRA